MTITLKTRLFVNEPMAGKPVIDVPGVGEPTERILHEKRITTAEQLYNIWLRLRKDKTKFDKWLKYTCGSAYLHMSSELITHGFEKWHLRFGQDEKGNSSDEGSEDHKNNKRQSTPDVSSPLDIKKTKPDNSNLGSAENGHTESRSSETRPTEIGATETSPPESRPSGTRASETRPSATRLSATSPMKTSLSESSISETRPSETRTSETRSSCHLVELDVSVVREDDQLLNESQVTAVNVYLEESILATVKDPNASAPRFKRVSIADGALQLSCEDDLSLSWLKATIANAPEIDAPKVTVKGQSELTKKYKVAIYIPDCRNSVDDTLLLLTKQNEWAQIKTWLKHSEMKVDSALFLEFLIPERVVPALMQRGGKLSYYLGSVGVLLSATDGYQPSQPIVNNAN